MSALSIYSLLRLDTISREMHYRTGENKARIGRLIRELNIIHNQKRIIDDEQTRKISNAKQTIGEIVEDHKMMGYEAKIESSEEGASGSVGSGGSDGAGGAGQDGEDTYEYFERL